MTSTSFNAGVAPETRSSSRVLKPPGGGHSDIFGIYDKQDQQTPRMKYTHARSTIGEVFGGNSNGKESTEKTFNNQNHKTDEEIKRENNTQQFNENEEPKPQPTPQRTRVPPGGFSSGLW